LTSLPIQEDNPAFIFRKKAKVSSAVSIQQYEEAAMLKSAQALRESCMQQHNHSVHQKEKDEKADGS
jgi:hypothetical protein